MFFSFSCSDRVAKETIMKKLKKIDEEIKEIIPEKIEGNLKDAKGGINPDKYGVGCIRAFVVRVKEMDTIFVEFETPEQAFKESLRIDAYYRDNWVFDDVSGEPRLESFFEKIFPAIRPLKNCLPKDREKCTEDALRSYKK
jgi:hypothetical protein